MFFWKYFLKTVFSNFLSGKVKENENPEEAIEREVLEETGMEIDDFEIEGPLSYLVLFPLYEIYYYVINTNKNPNLSKTNYT